MKLIQICPTNRPGDGIHAIQVPIGFNLINSFLIEFGKEIKKIQESGGFCDGIYFKIDLEEHYWRVNAGNIVGISNSLHIMEHEITEGIIASADKIEIPCASLIIVFEHGFHSRWEDRTAAVKRVAEYMPMMMEIVEKIIEKIN